MRNVNINNADKNIIEISILVIHSDFMTQEQCDEIRNLADIVRKKEEEKYNVLGKKVIVREYVALPPFNIEEADYIIMELNGVFGIYTPHEKSHYEKIKTKEEQCCGLGGFF